MTTTTTQKLFTAVKLRNISGSPLLYPHCGWIAENLIEDGGECT
jgi:hypothetical protein